MKKFLLALTALALLAGMGIAQVESGNIVGFVNVDNPATGSPAPTLGNTFVTVGGEEAEYTLADIIVENMDTDNDFIQILSPDNAATILTATYADLDTAIGWGDADWVGWWDRETLEEDLNDVTFSAATGFLGNFNSPGVKTIVLTGEVVQDEIVADLSGLRAPLLVNPLPADITLGDIVMTGIDTDNDFIQILSPANAATIATATYADLATATEWDDPDWVGWWDRETLEEDLNETVIPAGSGFLGNFNSPGAKTITFPNPMTL